MAADTGKPRHDWLPFAVAILIIVAVVLIAHSPIGSWKFP